MNKITLILLLFCVSIINAQDESYTIKNVSSNTKYSDFGVSYFGENTALFASARKDKAVRKRVWIVNNQPFLELYKGSIVENGDIADVERFSKVLNSRYHESNVTFTKDLTTVYFTRNNYINKKVKKDATGMILNQLFRAKIGEDGDWTDIQPMPFNSDNYQTGHPALNDREDKLYFISDMPGSLGLTDIYVVDIKSDGSYGEPINLGPDVNTSKSEMFPFIDENNVLYFASKGFEDSKGGLDVYATKIIGHKSIEKAKNIGAPINTQFDDFSFVLQKGKKIGYFSSNRIGGKGDDDIYSFEELKPVNFDCKQFAEGVVREIETGALLPGALVVLFDSEGNKVESIIADKYGSFSFKLDCKRDYKVVGSKEYYTEGNEQFTTSDKNESEVILKITLRPIEFLSVRGRLMVNINPIYFDLDKAEIRDDAAIELQRVLVIMLKYPELKIDLGSHTDSRSPNEYNMNLSNLRAKASVEWVIAHGIDASRITGKGYGETQLVNKCADGVKCSELEHQLNRRTEFVVINPEVIK